jgi:hypothetical protein
MVGSARTAQTGTENAESVTASHATYVRAATSTATALTGASIADLIATWRV